MAPITDTDDDRVQARASVRYLHVSPTKVRPVLDLVRGLAAQDAQRTLQITQRDAAGHILKVLDSAIANAEHNFQLPADEVFIARCWCDEGPTRGGGRARARGRYFRIRKRTSHITIVLERLGETELEARRAKLEASAVRGGSARRRAERVRASRRAAREQATEEGSADLTELDAVVTEDESETTTVESALETADTEASADAVELETEVAAESEPGASDETNDSSSGSSTTNENENESE